MKRSPKRTFIVQINTQTGLVVARTVGAAVRKMSRALGIPVITDRETGGWKNVSAAIVRT